MDIDVLNKNYYRIYLTRSKNDKYDKNVLELKKNKFLITKTVTLKYFHQIIKKKLNINESESLFLFVNNNILNINSNLEDIFKSYNKLNILYIEYAFINCYG